MAVTLTMPPMQHEEMRFLDLIDDIEDPFECGFGESPEKFHGPWNWSDRLSDELQAMVDTFCNMKSLRDLGFSLTIADPSYPDCPLVACSAGFTALTGYQVQEIVGRNCRFLLDGVPPHLLDEETRYKCRAFCIAAAQGEDYRAQQDELPEAIQSAWPELPHGEIICVQTNARKDGELFRNMFYMKQVELDDMPYIIGLQSGLPEDFDSDTDIASVERACRHAFAKLSDNMTTVQQLFAARFWYSAPMRRQV